MEDTVGMRAELTEDIQHGKKGDRGVIGMKAGHIGIALDSWPGALIIVHAGMPITNFVKIIPEDREPELQQLSLFGDSE